MNDLQIFNNPDFGDIRAVEIDGEGWFVGRDVAKALGYSKPYDAVARHIDSEDTLKRGILDTNGKTQQTIVINESGVYSLIILSEIPSAKKFKRWITSEVLPSIRKTGGYVVPKASPNEIIMMMAQSNIELEKKVLAIEQKLDTAIQVFSAPHADHWKDDIETTINTLINANGLSHPKFRAKLYEELKFVSGKDINAKLRGLQKRLQKQGYTYAESHAVNRLDAISKDKQLRAIFEDIVKKYQVLYSSQMLLQDKFSKPNLVASLNGGALA